MIIIILLLIIIYIYFGSCSFFSLCVGKMRALLDLQKGFKCMLQCMGSGFMSSVVLCFLFVLDTLFILKRDVLFSVISSNKIIQGYSFALCLRIDNGRTKQSPWRWNWYFFFFMNYHMMWAYLRIAAHEIEIAIMWSYWHESLGVDR